MLVLSGFISKVGPSAIKGDSISDLGNQKSLCATTVLHALSASPRRLSFVRRDRLEVFEPGSGASREEFAECPKLAHYCRADIRRSGPLLKANLPRRLHGRMVSE